ncbi:MAG: hypothetical protein KDE51_10550 [Anaerolineales bacterium]|nr:hypothetical protein [Anaerolineales bacterium]
MANRWLVTITQITFGSLLGLALISHAAPPLGGPFGWWPLPLPVFWAGFGWRIGLLALLPVLVLGGWMAEQRPRRWQWGPAAVTLPLAMFTVLIMVRLTAATVHYVALLGLCWFVYLFLVNHPSFYRQTLFGVLAAALLLQGTIAMTQFWSQQEVGLTWLGEPVLEVNQEGTSVVQRGEAHWLRAYGVNSHPNQLGLLLTALCLLLWQWRPLLRTEEQKELSGKKELSSSTSWQPLCFWLSLAVGLGGLLFSLSRSAWLALALGGAVYLVSGYTRPRAKQPLTVPLSVLGAGLLLFGFTHGDVVVGRFWALDSPLESRSLLERQRDTHLALAILASDGAWGVGLGQYQTAATQLDPDAAVVHNVPLLMGAELGWLGLALWLVWWLAPLVAYGRDPGRRTATAVWLAMLTIALVQPEPTLFLPKGALLWGLAAAQWAVYEPQLVTSGSRL